MSMVLEITVQETVGGVVNSVAGAEVTVQEQTAVSQAVVIETGVSSASLSDLLLIRDDTEAARADAEASEAAALAHKNAAATSEANALSHKNAAASSKTAAAASATAAATSEANALSHKKAADSSATAAAASATAAATSAENALSHKNAADSSKTAAAVSATAAATSEANALSHKNAADSSKTAAAASATAAATSEANALSHKNAAGVSATAASDSKASAALSAANAGVSEAAAAASAAKAQQYATIVASAMIFRGGWSAAGGAYPTPSMNPETSDYYRITVGGTMTGAQGNITVTAGDYLHWDMTLDKWFKVDAVDAVTSVAGRTGDVSLTKSDVGLANVQNVDQTNAANITSGTLAKERLPATIDAATTGNAATATKLATARTLATSGDVSGSVAFDGTANVTIPTTLSNTGVTAGTYKSVTVDAKGRVTAGTNPTTIAGYGITDAQPLDAELTAFAGLSTNGIVVKTAAGTATTRSISIGGTGLSITNADGVAGNPTITSNATNLNTVSTIVARDASGNFSAGIITAALSGNASTATKLATARTINGVAFDGTANITIADNTKLALNINNDLVVPGSIHTTSTDTTDMLSVSGRTYSIALTTYAQSIFDGNNAGLAEGIYLVYVAVDNYMSGGGEYNEHYVGLMYWFPYTTNSPVADEIPLHRMGHAPNNGRVHLRTCRNIGQAPGVLQIWSDTASGAANYYLAFKRVM